MIVLLSRPISILYNVHWWWGPPFISCRILLLFGKFVWVKPADWLTAFGSGGCGEAFQSVSISWVEFFFFFLLVVFFFHFKKKENNYLLIRVNSSFSCNFKWTVSLKLELNTTRSRVSNCQPTEYCHCYPIEISNKTPCFIFQLLSVNFVNSAVDINPFLIHAQQCSLN